MPTINGINTAVFKVLNNDVNLTAVSSVYKGAKRPSNAINPSVTVDAKRLAPGGGEGIWMCDVVVTAYADMLSNRMPDHETLDNMTAFISEALTDKVIELDNGKALPLIEGESAESDWDNIHGLEAMQEITFGLVFIKFN